MAQAGSGALGTLTLLEMPPRDCDEEEELENEELGKPPDPTLENDEL